MNTPPLKRWRLLLGEAAEDACGGLGGDDAGGGADGVGTGQGGDLAAMDRALGWLYGRDEEARDRHQHERSAGLGPSTLTVPEWINAVHRLFPKETIERLERDAVERYRIDEIVTSREVLERVQPNPTLLKAVLRTRHLMNPEVLALARALVAEVVRQLIEALATELVQAFAGVRNRRRRTRVANSRNFDAAATLRANLKHYNPSTKQLVLRQPLFNTRSTRAIERWQLVLVVDQSGSMLDSVIHTAVTAACLHRLPGIRTHLVAFDTNVVDLTDEVDDPVETLMRVQLGGGTDIARAMQYAAELVENPRRAIVVLVSDLYEGGSPAHLVSITQSLVAQGTRVLVLAALDEAAEPAFDRVLGARLVEHGAEVGAMTPGELAAWLAQKLRR
jgi:hypothetical protein